MMFQCLDCEVDDLVTQLIHLLGMVRAREFVQHMNELADLLATDERFTEEDVLFDRKSSYCVANNRSD